MREERPRNSNAPAGCGRGRLIADVVFPEHEPGPLSDQVGCWHDAGVSLPYIFIEAAAAAEGKAPSCYLEAVDAAVHPAGLADEAAGRRHFRGSQGEKVRIPIEGDVRPFE